MIVVNVDAHACDLGRHIASRALTVVSEEPEWNIALAQLADESVGSGDQFRPAIQDAVHVD
jgi:hypothetical protein